MKKLRILNGYILRYKPNHPRAFLKGKNNGHVGYVYEHVLVAEQSTGRKLRTTEHVHHLDFDRSNNCPNNLVVLDEQQHVKLHAWISRGAPILGKYACGRKAKKRIYEHSKLSHKQFKIRKIPRCLICSMPLGSGTIKTCTAKCRQLYVNAHSPLSHVTAHELKSLLAKLPWTRAAAKFGVSDNALRKKARKLGLDPKKLR